MQTGEPERLFYKRSRFVTHLPRSYCYSRSHAWAARAEAGVWRVGLTRFATRMLGEVVDHGFDTPLGSPIRPGQVVGWIEGFKAISDLFCIGEGEFAGGNPALKENIRLVSEDPYGQGWMYQFKGCPDPACVDVLGYRAILDETIDRILEQQKSQENP